LWCCLGVGGFYRRQFCLFGRSLLALAALTPVLAWATLAAIAVAGALLTAFAAFVFSRRCIAIHRCCCGCCLAIGVHKAQLGLLVFWCGVAVDVILAWATVVAAATATTATTATFAAFTWLVLAFCGGFTVAIGFGAGFVATFTVVSTFTTGRTLLTGATVAAFSAIATGRTILAGLVAVAILRSIAAVGIDLHIGVLVQRLAFGVEAFTLGIVALAFATTSASTTSATAITATVVAVGTAITIASFGAFCTAFAARATAVTTSAIAVAVTTTATTFAAFAFVFWLGHRGRHGLGRYRSFAAKQAL
jgi:hypothetical protein